MSVSTATKVVPAPAAAPPHKRCCGPAGFLAIGFASGPVRADPRLSSPICRHRRPTARAVCHQSLASTVAQFPAGDRSHAPRSDGRPLCGGSPCGFHSHGPRASAAVLCSHAVPGRPSGRRASGAAREAKSALRALDRPASGRSARRTAHSGISARRHQAQQSSAFAARTRHAHRFGLCPAIGRGIDAGD